MKKLLFSFLFLNNLCYSQEYTANAGSSYDYYNNQRRDDNYNGQRYQNDNSGLNNGQYANNQNRNYPERQVDNYSNINNNQNNEFLQPSASPRKGMDVRLSVYKMDRQGLYRDQLNAGNLQKAILIFFGSWCPYCSKYLNNLSRNINELVAAGIRIIFVHVPTIERLQNWQTPTDADYNDAYNRLSSFGIKPDNSIELVLLGDRNSLNNNSIDSLPTMLAVKNGQEQFRGGSDNSIDIADFSQADKLKNFLQIWEDKAKENVESCEEECKKKCQLRNKQPDKRKSNKTDISKTKTSKINVQKANRYTDKLNKKYAKFKINDDNEEVICKKKQRPICRNAPKRIKRRCRPSYQVNYCPRKPRPLCSLN